MRASPTWTGVPAGPRPRIAYGRRDVAFTPTGEVIGAPRGLQGVLPYADGHLVADTRFFEGTNGLDLVVGGRTVESWPSAQHCSSGLPASSRTGDLVAWVTVRCPEGDDRSAGAVHRAASDGTGEVTVSLGGRTASVVGFLGDAVVYNSGFDRGAWITHFDAPPRRLPRVRSVVAVSSRLLLVRLAVGDAVTNDAGEVRWRAEHDVLRSFSPDGAAVLASRKRRLTIHTATTGEVRAGFDLPDGVRGDSIVWESDRTLLALAKRQGRVAIVRLSLDGSVERATPTVRVRRGTTSYVLWRR
ncbi:hypothetical protein [Nocardioides daejeonensis]|uniref:hypothetical protein n=1 Tax=Nocardioides daejeonensis TaxID=1046556 RepID=UPI000D74CBB9|nr:hypothetical protein [Nocardioides daejeonensis]